MKGKSNQYHLNIKVTSNANRVLSASFQFPFSIDVNMLNIVQHGDTFELRINNQVFAHLYNQGKFFFSHIFQFNVTNH